MIKNHSCTKLDQKNKNPFNKLISKAFSPHLSIYVKSQERNLAELIQRFHTDFDNEVNQTIEVILYTYMIIYEN